MSLTIASIADILKSDDAGRGAISATPHPQLFQISIDRAYGGGVKSAQSWAETGECVRVQQIQRK